MEKHLVKNHRDLRVYQSAMSLAVHVFECSKGFPREEAYSLTDQIRRSSRSVCANLAEAWHKRRYEAAFVAKVNDAEAEAAETQVWLEVAVRYGYLSKKAGKELFDDYNVLIGPLIGMMKNKEQWTLAMREDTEHYCAEVPDDPF
jgi:four helix bundle protein